MTRCPRFTRYTHDQFCPLEFDVLGNGFFISRRPGGLLDFDWLKVSTMKVGIAGLVLHMGVANYKTHCTPLYVVMEGCCIPMRCEYVIVFGCEGSHPSNFAFVYLYSSTLPTLHLELRSVLKLTMRRH
jgi:hypothetical protein